MKKMKLDYGLLLLAVTEAYPDMAPQTTGYLRLQTGEIVFLYDNDEDARKMNVDQELQRDEITANPNVWIEIPICPSMNPAGDPAKAEGFYEPDRNERRALRAEDREKRMDRAIKSFAKSLRKFGVNAVVS